MAYLFVKGQQDPIEINQEDALKVKRALDSNKPFGTIIPLADSSWKLSEVKGIKLDKKITKDDETFKKQFEEYKESRQRILGLPLNEKAKQCLSHFDIFYYGIYEEYPSKKVINKILSKIMEFFKKNPFHIIPPLIIYMDVLHKEFNLSKTFSINSLHWQILEKAEWNENKYVENKKQFIEQKQLEDWDKI